MGERAKYRVVRDLLAERVGQLQPRTQLPTEAVLCQEYGVSRITVRRAVDDLIALGLLVREQGRGTFVTEPAPPDQFREAFANRVRGYYRQQTEAGHLVTTRVLANAVSRDPNAAESLHLAGSADLIRLDRVRLVNGLVQQHSTTWLEAAAYPRVLAHDFSSGSLYEFLEANYAVVLTGNDLVVRVALSEAEVADAFGIEPGIPVLAMASTVFAGVDTPVAYGITHFMPGNSEITISLRDTGEPRSALAATVRETVAVGESAPLVGQL